MVLLRFVAVGTSATFIDFCTYKFLIKLNLNTDLAKISSFIVGTLFGYLGNRRITFQSKSRKLLQYLGVYLFSFTLNSSINFFARHTIENLNIAWILATSVSVTSNLNGSWPHRWRVRARIYALEFLL